MFEEMTDRIAGTLLMGLDVAVEFATLGEFRLVEADASPASDDFQALPLVRRPASLAAVTPDRQLLPPASTAIARPRACISKVSASGGVANMTRVSDLSGDYSAAQGEATIGAGGGGISMKNSRNNVAIAPRRRTAGPVRAAVTARTQATPRKRAGAVEANTQLCLFTR